MHGHLSQSMHLEKKFFALKKRVGPPGLGPSLQARRQAGKIKNSCLLGTGPPGPENSKKNKTKLLGRKRVGPPEKLFIYIPPSPATVQVYRIL